MSDTLTLWVKFLFDHRAEVAGAPAGKRGEVAEVPFAAGARLVAAGFAEAVDEEPEKPKRKAKDKD